MKRIYKGLISMSKNYPGGRKRAVVLDSEGLPAWNKEVYLGPPSKYIEPEVVKSLASSVSSASSVSPVLPDSSDPQD